MARYKHTDAEDGQGMFLSLNLKEQLLSGTFEYMLNDLIRNKIDISLFDDNYKNDNTGSKAIPPAVLIKLIIYGYSKGIKSSRGLAELAEKNITAKALTGDIEPHWTTIANFISTNHKKFQEIFIKVLAYCVELELVGGETFAIDGCRLPSNASIEMSGTKKELEKKLGLYRKMAERHTAKHRRQDECGGVDKETAFLFQERQKKLNRQIEKIGSFLEQMEQKEGWNGKELKSNVTDNESAMIKSSSGFLQGYIGIAISDKQNQIIINAEAVGSTHEGEHFPKIIDNTLDNMKKASVKIPDEKNLTVLMDSNYFSEENLKKCQEAGIEAIIPDKKYRKRQKNKDELFYEPSDFKYYEDENYYECPNGKIIVYKKTIVLSGKELDQYKANLTDCRACPLNTKCIKTKKEMSALFRGRILLVSKSKKVENLCSEMIKKFNTEEYQDKYAYRIQIVEPVFANIKYCKGLDSFTLRGSRKVNGQWKLYCIMHNLSKCIDKYNKKREYA